MSSLHVIGTSFFHARDEFKGTPELKKACATLGRKFLDTLTLVTSYCHTHSVDPDHLRYIADGIVGLLRQYGRGRSGEFEIAVMSQTDAGPSVIRYRFAQLRGESKYVWQPLLQFRGRLIFPENNGADLTTTLASLLDQTAWYTLSSSTVTVQVNNGAYANTVFTTPSNAIVVTTGVKIPHCRTKNQYGSYVTRLLELVKGRVAFDTAEDLGSCVADIFAGRFNIELEIYMARHEDGDVTFGIPEDLLGVVALYTIKCFQKGMSITTVLMTDKRYHRNLHLSTPATKSLMSHMFTMVMGDVTMLTQRTNAAPDEQVVCKLETPEAIYIDSLVSKDDRIRIVADEVYHVDQVQQLRVCRIAMPANRI